MIADPLSASPSWRSVTVTEPGELVAFWQEEVDVVILPRPLTEEVEGYARRLLDDASWRLRCVLDPGVQDVAALADALPAGAGRGAFVDDLWRWAELTHDLLGGHEVGVRLQRLTEPMCPAFHVDRVIGRVITTYLGAGTEWLEHAALPPHRAEPGAIAVFKGDVVAGRGVVHRSPPMARGDRRLVATFDAVE